MQKQVDSHRAGRKAHEQAFEMVGVSHGHVAVPGDRLTPPELVLFFAGLMANKSDKWPTNVAGKFYVDQQCIDCDLCRETAPSFFTRNDEGGYSYVSKQPTTDDEVAQCMEALEGCPVEAIGNDGED